MKICPKCSNQTSEFSNNKKTKDGLSRICKQCMAIEQKKSYMKHKGKYLLREKEYILKKKDKIDQIKKNIGCEKCGDKRHYVLVFHHVNPKEKSFEISNKVKQYNLRILLEEINKCKILCHNCHNEFHYLERINHKFSIEEYIKNNIS